MTLDQHRAVYAALLAQFKAATREVAQAQCAFDNAANEVEAKIAELTLRQRVKAQYAAIDMADEYFSAHLSALAIAANRATVGA